MVILGNGSDEAVRQAIRIVGFVLVEHIAIAIVLMQATLGRDPEVAGAILEKRVDRVLPSPCSLLTSSK